MEIAGQYHLGAPRAQIWERLFDPEVLRVCIPGCKELTQAGENSFDAKVQLKIGPVSATFAATVEIVDIDAPMSCRIVGKGNGGIAGFAKGDCVVNLEEVGAATVLTYKANAEIGGKLAALGGRLIQATSRKLADQFFETFSNGIVEL
ncbi:carbon monoxide dehydrogenase subunit G [Mycoplana sp. BE70]|uniref:CoxG family protein n=1 Tax=Mycoplana sp. BE70 TaxID=2817775 RepID=UPI002859874D|nr:carbon monoxide dehydrogenase subunit G [Mycoplana sp. BE70]MDR6757511.1 carbon monoxide dehydrogenase subunit G [Mycoplana sp. BE70]